MQLEQVTRYSLRGGGDGGLREQEPSPHGTRIERIPPFSFQMKVFSIHSGEPSLRPGNFGKLLVFLVDNRFTADHETENGPHLLGGV